MRPACESAWASKESNPSLRKEVPNGTFLIAMDDSRPCPTAGSRLPHRAYDLGLYLLSYPDFVAIATVQRRGAFGCGMDALLREYFLVAIFDLFGFVIS